HARRPHLHSFPTRRSSDLPQRLEDRVRESEHEQVLDRLLPEVVVDAVDLLLAEDGAELAVEGPRALVIASERLLDDDARPAALRDRKSTRLNSITFRSRMP